MRDDPASGDIRLGRFQTLLQLWSGNGQSSLAQGFVHELGQEAGVAFTPCAAQLAGEHEHAIEVNLFNRHDWITF